MTNVKEEKWSYYDHYGLQLRFFHHPLMVISIRFVSFQTQAKVVCVLTQVCMWFVAKKAVKVFSKKDFRIHNMFFKTAVIIKL